MWNPKLSRPQARHPRRSSNKPPDIKPVDKDKGPAVKADKPQSPPDKDKKPKQKDKDKGPPEKAKEPPMSPVLRHILNELALFPPTMGGKSQPVDPASLPAFPANVLDVYKPEYKSLMDFAGKEDQFPLRAAIAKTVAALRENANAFKMRQQLVGNLKDKELQGLKNQAKNEQDNLASRTAILKDLVKELEEVGAKRRDAAAKRWQVLYDYSLLRLKARIVYVVEYNFNLAKIRNDSLPALEEGDKLYRLTPQEKVATNEAYIKQYVKDLKKGWPALASNYPDTPWAVMAQREQAVMLGLSWQPAKQ